MNSLLLLAAVPALKELLITFLVLLVILAVIGGLIWAIETWIHPIPAQFKLVIALVLVLLVIIWAVMTFLPG